MVAVGDVEAVYGFERFDKLLSAGNTPDGVLNAVGCGEVVKRLFAAKSVNEGVNALVVAIGEEDRSGVAAHFFGQSCAVIFFGHAGALVALDFATVVVINMTDCHDTGLAVIPHLLAVEEDAGLGFADQCAGFLEFFEVLNRLGVHFVGVRILPLGEIDFCPDHMQHALRLAFGQLAGLFGRDHIVG